MTDTDLVDRLAEWCRLSERGYTRDDDGSWVPDRPGLDRVAWRPIDSDDDCRVVLEAVPEDKRSALLDAMYDLSGADDDEYDMLEYLTVFEQFLLYASPREKCQAVLKVL